MEIRTTRSMHPLTAIAAVSVTLFSLAGIGAITGLIPTSHSQSATVPVTAPAAEPLKSAAAMPPVEPLKSAASTPPVEIPAAAVVTESKPAASKPTVKHAKPAAKAAKPVETPVTVSRDEPPVKLAQNTPPAGYGPPPGYAPPPGVAPPPGYAPPPAVAPPPVTEAPKPICHDCGVIESVREVEKTGEGSGLGAVAGGVAGGLLGRQTGGGRGRDVMTVLGAIGGAVAGNAVEKNVKKVKSYEVAIRFEDGSSRLMTQDHPPAWRTGDRVRLVNGAITANNS